MGQRKKVVTQNGVITLKAVKKMDTPIKKMESGAWHSITRALSVAIVFGIIGGSFWIGYEKGKTKGYSLASKDRATQTYEAQNQNVTNTYVYAERKAFSLLSWGTWSLISKDVKVAAPVVTQQVIVPGPAKEVKKK